jgi:pimeloyl-ACP methyl ester carboxylesterase
MRRRLNIAAGGALLLLIAAIAAVVIQANWAISRMEVRSPAYGAPGRMLTISGHRWHVQTIGNPTRDPTGAPILLIHGFVVTGAASFQPWAKTQLHGRSLILPDLLGYGHSERIPVAGPWYSLRSSSDNLAVLLDQLGVSQVDLIGHSYGGSVAAQFALDHPDRVRRIVYIDAGIYVPASPAERIMQFPLGIGRAATWHAFAGGPRSLVSYRCERYGCPGRELARVQNTTDTLRALMRSHRIYAVKEPLIPRLPRLRKPALAIWGERDPIVPLSDGERLARETHARLVVIKGERHMPFRQHPKLVGSYVSEFLSQQGRR